EPRERWVRPVLIPPHPRARQTRQRVAASVPALAPSVQPPRRVPALQLPPQRRRHPLVAMGLGPFSVGSPLLPPPIRPIRRLLLCSRSPARSRRLPPPSSLPQPHAQYLLES